MESKNNGRLDTWLDQALREYGDVEPRAGLETRILANLASSSGAAFSRRWWPSFAALALVAALAAAIWIANRPTRPAKESVATAASGSVMPATNSLVRPPSAANMKRSTARRRTHVPDARVLARQPRLKQFPSPRPLSEQEQLLTEYVAQFHDKAVLMARAQTKLRKQEQQDLVEEAAQNDRSGISE